MTAAVKGLGGVFLYAEDPKGLSEWYARYLGLAFMEWGEGTCYGLMFTYTDPDGAEAQTIFSLQKAKEPLGKGRPECMVNWRVADLEALCRELQAAGVAIEKREDSEYGRFAWIHDPEGHRVELYQPAAEPDSN